MLTHISLSLSSLHLCAAEGSALSRPSLHHRQQPVLLLLCAAQGHKGKEPSLFSQPPYVWSSRSNGPSVCVAGGPSRLQRELPEEAEHRAARAQRHLCADGRRGEGQFLSGALNNDSLIQ